MSVSALPRKKDKIYKKSVKNIPEIIDHNLKNAYQTLIIFGINISNTIGFYMTV